MVFTSFRGSLLLPVLSLGGAVAMMACGDDGGTGGLGGQAGSTSSASSGGNTKTTGASTKTSSSASSGDTTATSSTTATATATATATTASTSASAASSTTATTASTSASAASTSTGAMTCMGVQLVSVSDALCDGANNLATLVDNVGCTDLSDPSFFPLKVYALPVAASDCVHVRVTNVMGATLVSDVLATVIDPDGGNHAFDDDVDCIPGNGDGLCPEGGLTMPAAGTAYIAVGAYAYAESPGCPAGGNTDYLIGVSVNGTAIDMSAAPVCISDLNDL